MTTPEIAVMTIPEGKESIEYTPFGTNEKIKLSVSIVQMLVAVPTKSGKLPSRNDCIKFMMLCRARHLNPFEGDAYLLGYDAQDGPQFSLITAHQVFLKRAEASENFSGMESGVIVTDKEGNKERECEGDYFRADEKLVGGWAKVYRRDRDKPFYKRLNLGVFNTGRSRWAKDPAGMIVKCAEADALRAAFPTHLGGLYNIEESRSVIDVKPALPEGECKQFDKLIDPVIAGQIYGAYKALGISRQKVDELATNFAGQMKPEEMIALFQKDIETKKSAGEESQERPVLTQGETPPDATPEATPVAPDAVPGVHKGSNGIKEPAAEYCEAGCGKMKNGKCPVCGGKEKL